MMPTFANPLATNKFTSRGGILNYGWLLSLFVGLLCTNMAKPAAAQTNDTSLTPVGSITKAMTNQQVTVQAVISNVREPSSARAPYNVSLTEDGATLPLVYWSDMQPQLASKVKVGNVVRVTAPVNVYRDTLQLRLRNVASFIVVSESTNAPASATSTGATTNATAPLASTAQPAATVIGAIKADWIDRVVTISGTIATSDAADKTQRLAVQDSTGQILVVLGGKALSGLSTADLQPGRVITVTGPFKLENGTRQVVPDTSGAVKLAPR
jgi:DNA/RNA endonuclease YhcR with UshA esterase domain